MRGRVAFGFAAAAVVWCLFLVAAAFLVPAYSGAHCQGAPGGASLQCRGSSGSLLEVDGWLVVGYLGGVALLSVLVLAALHHVCAHGLDSAIVVAWCGILLLFFFSVLTGLSIGLSLLPAVLLLAASALLTPGAGGGGGRSVAHRGA